MAKKGGPKRFQLLSVLFKFKNTCYTSGIKNDVKGMTFPTSLSLNLFLCRMSKLFSTLRYLMVLASDFSCYGRIYVKLTILTIFNCTVQRQ